MFSFGGGGGGFGFGMGMGGAPTNYNAEYCVHPVYMRGKAELENGDKST